MIKKFYLAARYDRKEEMKKYRELLKEHGVEITSRWLEEPDNAAALGNWDAATIDLDDVRAADGMIFFSENPTERWPRGGRHVEFGYALALNKTIVVIGPKENVFHNLKDITHYESFDKMLQHYLEVLDEEAYFGV